MAGATGFREAAEIERQLAIEQRVLDGAERLCDMYRTRGARAQLSEAETEREKSKNRIRLLTKKLESLTTGVGLGGEDDIITNADTLETIQELMYVKKCYILRTLCFM